MKALTSVSCALVFIATAFLPFASAYGDDLNSPEDTPVITDFGSFTWARPQINGDINAPQTTYQEWFNITPNPTPNPFPIVDGPPVILRFGDGIYTDNTNLNSSLFTIGNFVDQDTVKLLRLQITLIGDNSTINPFVLLTQLQNETVITPSGGTVTLLPDSGGFSLPTTMTTYLYQDWLIQPNPSFETLMLSFSSTSLSQVVIDTISFTPVPEPTTMLLLGSSLALGAFAKRRKG